MQQAWLSVYGATLDALGVLCITAEWVLGYFRERNPRIIEGYSVEPIDPAEKQWLVTQNARSERRLGLEHGNRMGLIVIGVFSLLIGFALQVLGSLPDGVTLLGTEFRR